MPCKPVESLACDQDVTAHTGYAFGGGIANLLLWFIIIAVIFWFILWTLRPRAVQRLTPTGEPTGEVDAVKVLVGSIIIALIIVVILWLIRACARW